MKKKLKRKKNWKNKIFEKEFFWKIIILFLQTNSFLIQAYKGNSKKYLFSTKGLFPNSVAK